MYREADGSLESDASSHCQVHNYLAGPHAAAPRHSEGGPDEAGDPLMHSDAWEDIFQ